MTLQLTKPLAFIDLETTGLNITKDRIVEIAVLKILPSGEQEVFVKLVNPTIPIPEEVSKIHDIWDKDIVDAPTFAQLAPELNTFLLHCDLAGYNSNKFDIPMLAEEFYRSKIEFDMEKRKLVDVQNIFHKMEQRTLAAAYKFYCNKNIENAHSAEADITATYEVFKAQLEKYSDLKQDVASLSDFSKMNNNADLIGRVIYNEKGEEVFNFGKYKGFKVVDVFKKEPSYYNWMVDNDFPISTKRLLTAIRLRAMKK